MAERPIFVPNPESDELVKEVFLQLIWSPGFALVQKEKNIEALHKAAEVAGYKNILEVSTKSEHKRGQHLSAFHLKVKTKGLGEVPLESVFQGSKVFEKVARSCTFTRWNQERQRKTLVSGSPES